MQSSKRVRIAKGCVVKLHSSARAQTTRARGQPLSAVPLGNLSKAHSLEPPTGCLGSVGSDAGMGNAMTLAASQEHGPHVRQQQQLARVIGREAELSSCHERECLSPQ